MDCKTAYEIMMKYFDKEIEKDQEKILYEHISCCESCREGFNALKAACTYLETAEFEDPPADMESKIINKIKNYEVQKKRKIYASALMGAIIVWIGIAALFMYTPLFEAAYLRFYNIIDIDKGFIYLIIDLWKPLYSGAVKFLLLIKALQTVQIAVIDAYNQFIAAVILFLAIFFKLYGHLLKKN